METAQIDDTAIIHLVAINKLILHDFLHETIDNYPRISNIIYHEKIDDIGVPSLNTLTTSSGVRDYFGPNILVGHSVKIAYYYRLWITYNINKYYTVNIVAQY